MLSKRRLSERSITACQMFTFRLFFFLKLNSLTAMVDKHQRFASKRCDTCNAVTSRALYGAFLLKLVKKSYANRTHSLSLLTLISAVKKAGDIDQGLGYDVLYNRERCLLHITYIYWFPFLHKLNRNNIIHLFLFQVLHILITVWM